MSKTVSLGTVLLALAALVCTAAAAQAADDDRSLEAAFLSQNAGGPTVAGSSAKVAAKASLANAQDTGSGTEAGGSAGSAKTIKGTVSNDGKSFTEDKGKKSWTITNPEAVKGHEGRHVSLHAYIYSDKNRIRITEKPTDDMKK